MLVAEISFVVETFRAGSPTDGDGLAGEEEARATFEDHLGFRESGSVICGLLVRKRRTRGDGGPLLLAEQGREDEIGACDTMNFIEELSWFDGGECCCCS